MNVKEKIRTLKIFRVIVQIIFFIFMPSLFSQAFAGVKEAVALIGKGENLILSDFVIKLLILCTATIIFGRIFCGFVCSKWQVYLQKLKYIVLICVIGFCFLGKGEYVTKYSPWTVFSLVTSRNFKLGTYITGVVLLLLIVVGMMLKERFFCQFLCPLGAVFSLLPKLPIFHVKKKGQQCFERCSACTNRCPVHLKHDEADIRDGECISCGRCFVVCPHRIKKNK